MGVRVGLERLLGVLGGLGEHLQQHELAREPAREVGGPGDGLSSGLRAIGGDDDFHAERLFDHEFRGPCLGSSASRSTR